MDEEQTNGIIPFDNAIPNKKVDWPAFKEGVLQYALRYLDLGWWVFPLHTVDDDLQCTCCVRDCKDAGKHPRKDLAPNGVKNASKDPDKIREWFGPQATASNLAIATGPESNLTVDDIDIGPGKGGAETWRELIEEHGEPDTLIAETGSGGMHVLFQYNSALKTSSNTLGKGVDCRNDSGYIVAAPSRHRSGGTYKWVNWGTPVAVLPAHLTKKKEKRKRKDDPSRKKYTLEEVRRMLDVVPADDRDLWRHVGIILGRAFNRSEDAWKLYGEWAGKWKGKRSHNHDAQMREAFYDISQQDAESELSLGTIVHHAKENGWTPPTAMVANLATAMQIMEDDPDFCPVWYDEFQQRTLVGDPPREWTEADDLRLTVRFQRDKGLPKMALETVMRAVQLYADSRRKHIVRDWFDGLKWDGTERIVEFFAKYFGAEDTAYTRAVSRNFWVSMPARIYKPGCQCDSLVVLEGTQGVRKSSALRAIGGDWFTEQHASLSHKDFFENLRGKLLVEISEMGTFTRSEVEKVKSVITTTVDRYRPSYGRRAVDHPRQFVFAGTTNREDWNQDVTGARRFWPIACNGAIDVEGIQRDREQLFAEAVHRFKDGATWWEMPADETRHQQEERYVAPAWAEKIEQYINYDDKDPGSRKAREHGPLTKLTIAEVMEKAFCMPIGQWKKTDEMRVAEALKFLQWKKKRARSAGDRHWIWQPMSVEKAEKDAQ